MITIILLNDNGDVLIAVSELLLTRVKIMIMKNILVPVDFSIYAKSAARAAVAIAMKSNAHIHLLHVADIPEGWSNRPVAKQQEFPRIEEKIVEANQKLERFAKHSIFMNCNIRTYLRGGVIAEQITLFAKANNIELIVMGVHDSGKSDRGFIGSTAQRVMRTAACPVLNVKKEFNIGRIKKILVASDFKEDVNGFINTAKNLAEDLGANIDLAFIHIPDQLVDDKTMTDSMRKFVIEQEKVKFHTVIQTNSEKEKGILTCAEKRNANVIAMATHWRKQKASYQMGITEAVLMQSKLPVLSYIIDQPTYRV
jgi:nucleotide-binding universal stress UspA family protein